MIRNNKILLVIIILITLVILGTSCKKEDTSKEAMEYFKLKEAVGNFVLNVYNPSSQSDMADGLQAIKKYATKELYEELQNDMGEYRTDVTTSLSDLNISYIKKENSLNNLFDKIIVTFRLIDGNRSQVLAIEFIQNDKGLLDRYNIYEGLLEGR